MGKMERTALGDNQDLGTFAAPTLEAKQPMFRTFREGAQAHRWQTAPGSSDLTFILSDAHEPLHPLLVLLYFESEQLA